MALRKAAIGPDRDAVPSKPWNPDVALNNSEYFVFDRSSIMVFEPWPELGVWQRTFTKPWRRVRHLPLGMTVEELSSLDHFLPGTSFTPALVPQIPRNVWTRTLRFEERRWELLRLQAQVPEAADLLDSSPALGWMLANHWDFRGGIGRNDATRIAQRWIGMRQRDILGKLGFENSESMRRIIARISPRSVHVEMLLSLRIALKLDEQRKMLQHLPCLTVDVLRIVTDEALRSRVTPGFLRDICERCPDTGTTISHFLLGECLSNEAHLWPRLTGKLRSVEQLLDLGRLQRMNAHMQAEESYRSGRVARPALDQLAFPSPPWPGMPGIEPLTDMASLRWEGEEMRHCAGSFGPDTLKRTVYLYKVTQPVRATLSLRPVLGNWTIDQIRGPRNKPIDPVHEEAIRRLVANGLEPSGI